MAVHLLRKVLNLPSPLRIFVSSLRNNPSKSAPAATLLANQDKLDLAKKPPTHHLNSVDNDKIPFSGSCRIYPSFAFGYCLNLSHDLCSGEDVTQTIWADSVKKKRKKKMNKHKYKKLRKRLRRKT
ncbi:uncharacterized protein [Aristolochia californica]|uniref:uncharacterized protein n=1 Tax=Aristolochia californica TaxID=171875 RepID=UPI0035E0A2BB